MNWKIWKCDSQDSKYVQRYTLNDVVWPRNLNEEARASETTLFRLGFTGGGVTVACGGNNRLLRGDGEGTVHNHQIFSRIHKQLHQMKAYATRNTNPVSIHSNSS
jgi:hypothetical protein